MTETGTQRYKNALRAAKVLVKLDKLNDASALFYEAHVALIALEREAMQNSRIDPNYVLKTGIDNIPDRYVFRGILMTVIDAASTYVSFDEIKQELNLVCDMMWRDKADEVKYEG